jgi:hypothetical protein
MNPLKGLVAALIQDPSLLSSVVENPQTLAQLAGLGDAELRLLSSASAALTGGLVKRLNPPDAGSRISTACQPAWQQGGWLPARAGETEIVGIVALAAMLGGVVALGSVSMVALSDRRR